MANSTESQLFLGQVIYLPALCTLADGDRQFAEDLLQIFVGDASRQFERLAMAVQQRHYAEIYQAAHALKGACASIGAQAAQAICATLESQGKQATCQAAEQHLAELQANLQQIKTLAAATAIIPEPVWQQASDVVAASQAPD
jgi:HPt (histidine-containing phosphotransfer) domain-containing protein